MSFLKDLSSGEDMQYLAQIPKWQNFCHSTVADVDACWDGAVHNVHDLYLYLLLQSQDIAILLVDLFSSVSCIICKEEDKYIAEGLAIIRAWHCCFH